ncbi:MAG: ABC transporter substrate-binding protein [Caldilineaceae bacterium]|nr:ABC transporter substrate-binding protein [Caldilineaceae bacterium]
MLYSQRDTLRSARWMLLLTLLTIFTLVMAACGGGGSEPAAEEAAPAEEAAAPAEEATEAPAEEATAEEAPAAEEAAPAEEEALGSSLIGEIEGPKIITDEANFPAEFAEAPMLTEMVDSGDLPALADRLPVPSDLLVIQPVHEIGQYGGTWRRGFTGPADGQNGHRVAGGDRFVFWDAVNFPEVVPNLAKSWEINDGGKEIILHLREGVKWSDGEPFTTADVMFWFEHMYMNEELVPVRSPFFNVDEGATLEATDEYTLRFTFPFENSLFLEVLGSSVNVFGGQAIFGNTGMGGFAPAHYLEQFHPDFADQADIDAKVTEEGFDNWVNLFKDKNTWQRNPDLPVLTPWKTENPITTDNWVLVRNPYYFGVDTDGNQLPYIDRISMTLAEDLEVLNLRAIAGEYDYQARHISLANLPVLLENAEAGNYSVHLDPAQHGADAGFQINQSYRADEEIAKWLQNADFRRALSLGIDRNAINEVIFLGIGVPGSAVVAESSPFNPGPEYRELWSPATPDIEQANALLDSIGLTEKDADGYRLRTDNGERLVLEVNPIPAFIQFTKVAELVRDDWAELGIFLNVVEQERGLVETRRAANEIQMFLWQNDGTDELYLYPYHALPVANTSGTGPAYGDWYSSNGAQGIEPTDESHIKVFDLFSQGLKATPEERVTIGQEIWQIITDEVWTIGTVGQSGAFMGVRVVKNNMGNIPSRQFNIQAGQTPNISRPSTFYFTDAGE